MAKVVIDTPVKPSNSELVAGDGSLVSVFFIKPGSMKAFPHTIHNVGVAKRFNIYNGTEKSQILISIPAVGLLSDYMDSEANKDTSISDTIQNRNGIQCNRCKWRKNCWELRANKTSQCVVGDQELVEG